jgi:hypothetical protein
MTRALLILFVVAVAAGAFLLHDATHVPAPRSEAAPLSLPLWMLTPPATAAPQTGPLVVTLATNTPTPERTALPTKTPQPYVSPTPTLPSCDEPIAGLRCQWRLTVDGLACTGRIEE